MNAYLERHSVRFHLASLGVIAGMSALLVVLAWLSAHSRHDEAIWYGIAGIVAAIAFCFRTEDLSREETKIQMSQIELRETRPARPTWGERIRMANEADRRADIQAMREMRRR